MSLVFLGRQFLECSATQWVSRRSPPTLVAPYTKERRRNNGRSLTLQVGRVRLDSESQATSMGQLFILRILSSSDHRSQAESNGHCNLTFNRGDVWMAYPIERTTKRGMTRTVGYRIRTAEYGVTKVTSSVYHKLLPNRKVVIISSTVFGLRVEHVVRTARHDDDEAE